MSYVETKRRNVRFESELNIVVLEVTSFKFE